MVSKKGVLLIFGAVLLLSIFSLDFASSQVEGCCLETNDGNYCQDTSKTKCSGKFDTSACNEDPFGGQCDEVCDLDGDNNECGTITKAQAKDDGLRYENSACSETSLCDPGCCILEDGTGGDWVKNKYKCGEDLKFRPKSDKVDRSYCVSLATDDLVGSCLYDSGNCEPLKKKNCDGEFFPDKVCSELDGSYCEPKDEKVCHDGDIYYQDGCENNYEVVKKCNDNSYCATNSTGGKECKSFECNLNQLEGVEEDRVLENGESVCYYDGPAGNGADAPGTEHYKVACNKGELEPILCGDPNKPLRGREEVCVMNKQDDTSESGKDTYQAACVKNKVSKCYKIGKELNKITNDRPKNDDNLEKKLPSLRNKAVRHLKECRKNAVCQLTRTPRKPFLREDKRSVLDETVPTTRSADIGEEIFSRNLDDPEISTNSSPFDRSNIDTIKGILKDRVKKSKIDYKSPYISTFYLESNKVESSIVSRAYCLPRFPPGRKDTCKAASMDCEVTFTDQDYTGKPDEIDCTRREGDNCNCLSKETQKRMNNYCSRAGDCGLSVNFEGVKNSEFNLSNNIDYVEDGKSTNPGGSPREWYDPIPEAMKLIRDIYNEYPKPKNFSESYGFWDKSEKSLVLNKNIGSASSIGEAISSGLSGSLLKPNTINSSYGDWYKNQNPGNRGGAGGPLHGDHNTNVETIEYDCSPYEPKSLQNKQNDIECKEACNSGPIGCTAYKCENLAKECDAANPGFEKVVCHEDNKDDNNPPKIESIEYVSEDTSKDLKDSPQDLWELNDPISESVQTIKFNITTNEPAKCKFTRGNSDKRYSKLNQNHDSNELYLYEQTISFSSGDFDELADGPYMPGDKISRNVSVKFKDSFGGESGYGNTNQKSRYINYDLEAAEDTNPPIIDSYSPKKDKDWEYNPNNFTLDMEIEDRSNIKCSYSYGNLQSFSKADHNFTCDNKIAGKNINCNTTLNQTKKGGHSIDIICKDNSDNKNVADPKTYSYNITRDIPFDKYKRQYGLRIGNITADYELKGLKQSIRDGGNITTSEREPVVDISFKTIKGKSNGKSQCSYSSSNMQTFVDFGEKSNEHSLKLDLLRAPSNIEMDFKCDDGVSVHSKNYSFDLVYDDQGPVIVKNKTVEGGDLTITTNEPAQCSYSHESCKFSHSNGDPIWKGGQNSYSINQSTKWIPNRPYYIRCKDKYGNGRCSSINKASVINGPEVTRIWQDSGDIRVKTDRQAKCYYSFDTCNFDVSDQEDKSMTVGGSSLKHVTQWKPSNTYHIKCEDQWGNPNPSCAAIVQPHSLK